ncbi:hypothetical protein FIBSPDRAFT_908574 [Athelia psychrophila]|uniref:Uncharacterized protein n=1 Tax=Athelia psychrophila TaxID=1759441 RepID=A0A166RSG6_9AGAM|nr:hypothetical protein FIBSPDRAFT_908574 [Fibularhizoctonia sp. CBS 109695]
MMLVQKPPSFPSTFSTHNIHHKRNPSAPVVVLPTRTPGLLSLSLAKPTPTRQPQQQRVNRSPRSKPAVAHNRSPKPAAAEAQQLSSEAEAQRKTQQQQPTPAPTPDRHVRAQSVASKAPKDKMNRQVAISTPLSSCSLTGCWVHRSPPLPHTAQGRRNNVRQPSPPNPPSQAEDQTFTEKAKYNSFDPFFVNSSESESDRPAAAQAKAPKLATPSGKLARRRQAPHAGPATPTPAHARAIPMPRTSDQPNRGRHGRTHSAMMNLSRSAPITASSNAYGAFPVCDDSNDAEELTPPATPVEARQELSTQMFDNGPRTAPLSSAYGGYSFAALPSPMASPTLQRQRQHVRSPSEGVFNMSFDEDLSFSSSSDSASEELKMLFGLMPKRPAPGPRGKVHHSANSPSMSAAKAAKEALYASSLFQNSPSPDELPPPAF